MELEDLKNDWQKLSEKVDKQERLSTQLIEKMTKQKYRSGLNKIIYPEFIGTIICYLGALYLIVNFSKIDEIIMQIFGSISIALLLLLPIISLASIKGLRKVNVSLLSYSEAIRDYANKKIKFQKLQKLNVSLALAFLVITLPVLFDIKGKNISDIPYFWTVIFPLGVAFVILFSLWVLKNYNKALKEAEEVLLDLKN